MNGTHVYVEWTDPDDNGVTRTESKTLPHHATYEHQDNEHSYADLSGDLNSTYSSSGNLLGQNSTYAAGNESKTDIESENMTNAVTLNQSAAASSLEAWSLRSNSSSPIISSPNSEATTIHGPNLDNFTKTNTNTNTTTDVLGLSTGKLIADKIRGDLYTQNNGTNQAIENRLSAEDIESGGDGLPEGMRAKQLAALRAAQNQKRMRMRIRLRMRMRMRNWIETLTHLRRFPSSLQRKKR